MSLADVLPDFKPSLLQLQKVVSQSQKYNTDILDALVIESTIITLLTTISGITVLQILQKWPNLKKHFPTHKTLLHPLLVPQDKKDCLLKFTHFLLCNSHVHLDYTKCGKLRYKLPLLRYMKPDFKLDETDFCSISCIPLLIDEEFNLLIAYALFLRPQIDKILVEYKQNVPRLLQSYGKGYLSINYQPWYYTHTSINDLRYLSKLWGKEYRSILSNVQQRSILGQSIAFDLNSDGSLDIVDTMDHNAVRHDILFKVLNLHSLVPRLPLIDTQFNILCSLVDPLTQPTPNNVHVISIDLLHQLFLGILSSDLSNFSSSINGFDWKFHVCYNLQQIIMASMKRLNCSDFHVLNSVDNSDGSIHWKQNLKKWVPQGLNAQDLELIYMVNILAVYTIHKVYDPIPIQLNPFLSLLISFWKNLTCVILLGLEIDRYEEEMETFETPLIVSATLRGSAALRAVIASILNGQVEANKHDFVHEPLNTFMSPHGRKLCTGALYANLKSHAASLLSMGGDLEDVTELLYELQAGDRFDEDVKYMFEYEYDDYNEVLNEEDTLSENYLVVPKKRCNCMFDDDEVIEKSAALGSASDKTNTSSKTVIDFFEFDHYSQDWRDTPRGLNMYYFPTYPFVKETPLEEVEDLMRKATKEKISTKEAFFLLRAIASGTKTHQEYLLLTDRSVKKSRGVTPNDIYQLLDTEPIFEQLLDSNHDLAWRLMDEMLMSIGCRRSLIWIITHTKISYSLIHYVFELLMGMRGQNNEDINNENAEKRDLLVVLNVILKDDSPPDDTKLIFSRQGALQLSAVEKKMLLQDFFANAAIFFSDKSIESPEVAKDNAALYVIGLMRLICFMIRTFIENKVIDVSDSHSLFELQTLLMNWVSIVPDAKELFFQLKESLASRDNLHSERDSATMDTRYNRRLTALLPLMSSKDAEVAGIETLREYIGKFKFGEPNNPIGRKVVRSDDEILPLADEPLSLLEYMKLTNEFEPALDEESN